MRQQTVAFPAFWLLLLSIMLDGISPASAYPVSPPLPPLPRSDVSAHNLSGVQQEGSPPAPATLLPRDYENIEPRAPSVGGEVVYANESGTDESQTSDSADEEESSPHHGLNPNITAGIAIGAGFGILVVIAALMYAFRVGWEKGRKQKEKEMVQLPPSSQPPEPPASGNWQQINIVKPPEALLETGSSCWDSESWSCSDEHMEKYKPLGERYSFRPGKGVYGIREKYLEEVGEGTESRPSGENMTDSGLGLDEEGKGKEREQL